MADQQGQPNIAEDIPRDAAYWAKRRLTIEVNEIPSDATSLNVKGRHVTGPLQGFGQMWQKTYRITVQGVTPTQAIQEWKAHFGQFWPKGNRFYAPLTGIEPGEVGILNLPAPGGMRLSTGIVVLYADEESFTFMTPQGHMFAAFITFSAHEENGETALQIQPLLRANDPLWEIAMKVYGFHKEDEFWLTTLRKLAAHFRVYDQEPTMTATLIDSKRQWSQAKNIWHNAALRSGLHMITALPRRLFQRAKPEAPAAAETPKLKTVTLTTVTVPRDAPYWAVTEGKLEVGDVPEGAINLNVNGRQVISPLQGFGQLWQKTYRVRLQGVNKTPNDVMAVWCADFPKFQPADNHFYPPMTGIKPGDILFIDSMLPAIPRAPGIIPLASGVMVLYADDTSFTVMTPEGFPEAGWNTFSVYEENGVTVAQVQSMARATDPVYEFGFRLMGGALKQEKTWEYVLTSLAAHFGVSEPVVEINKTCLDRRIQWRQARNIWHNAGLRSMLMVLTGRFRRQQGPSA
jgi:hypothetical protein